MRTVKKRKTRVLLLILIILLAFFFRFYKLADFPVQLNHDEVSQLYDGMSILKTGKDIYGNRLPFIFISINDFKPPFYTYASLPFIYLTNGSDVSIRLLGALFGVILVFAVYFFTSKLFSNVVVSLIASFFTAISPFEIHFSRKGFEGVVGLTLVIFGLGLILGYLSSKKDYKKFILGSGILALSMYTYFSYAFLIPILYSILLIIFLRDRIKLSKWGIILFIILTVPLVFFVLRDKNSKRRTQAVAITQDSKLLNMIDANLNKDDGFYRLRRSVTVLRYSLDRYVDQFNPTFLFLNGLDMSNQDPFDVGLFYFFQLPLMIVGFIYFVKKYRKSSIGIFILILIFLGVVPSGFSFEEHSPHRILMTLSMLDIISALGAYIIFEYLFRRLKSKRIKLILVITGVGIVIWSLLYFLFLYTVNYPIDKSEFIQYPYKNVGQITAKYYDDYDRIIFDPRFGKDAPWVGGASYYYLAYYGKFPIEKMQKEYKVTNVDGKSVISFGKYEIRDVYWPVDRNLKNTLIIASPWVISEETFGRAKLLDEIKTYQGTITSFYVLSLK